MKRCFLFLVVCAGLAAGATSDEEAVRISQEIQARHLPYGTVLNPMYVSASSDELLTYTRCGDSAIWTGHWLAAEAFRYRATGSSDALTAVRRGVEGIRLLVDSTGSNLLARCVLRSDSPYVFGPVNEEKDHGVYAATIGGVQYRWVGDTSRDQYLGVFFGLSVAYESVQDETIRATIRDLVTRMLDRLTGKSWAVVMPNGDISTVFWLRPDQQLALLQVGRQVNPTRFASAYAERRSSAAGLGAIMALEASDPHGSYFKFNLSAITWYLILHLEEPNSTSRNTYLSAYRTFRNGVAGHGNAFFNTVDLALQGPESRRDAETQELLSAWLLRPTRDVWVDLRGKYPACGDNRACDPIPVVERVTTDFIWQRSPFQLTGGGSGQIESAGIDFILPWWMGRVYGAGAGPQAVSAASSDRGVAPESIASLFGSGFPASGARIVVRDASGVERPATVFYSGDKQINFLIPASTIPGPARVRLIGPDGADLQSTLTQVSPVAPAIFTANATGKGPPAATAILAPATAVEVFRCTGPLLCVARPLSPQQGRPVYLTLYLTGVRNARSVWVTFDGQDVPVEYTGAQGQFAGLDQINIRLERSLKGRGEEDLVVIADGVSSNAVRVVLE